MGVRPEDDEVLRQLVESNTEAVCIVAKASELHVKEALRTTLDEALAMASDSVGFLREHGLRVFFDAEHFFDGYRENPEFSMRVLRAAEEAGAQTLVLCDTNGGSLPHEVEGIVASVASQVGCELGVHFHNDSGCAVANSIAAVRAGATHVQGCVNGYGERTGNADLAVAIGDLSLKLGVRTIPPERLERLTAVSHHIAELVNIAPNPQQPYVGAAAFADKAGLHTSAIARRRDTYEHVSPDLVGKVRVCCVGDGRTLHSRAQGERARSGARLGGDGRGALHFEDAGAPGVPLCRGRWIARAAAPPGDGWKPDFFELESFKVVSYGNVVGGSVISPDGNEKVALSDDGTQHTTEATVKVVVGGSRVLSTAEGNGPVNALDSALRKGIEFQFPVLGRMHLTDYRVRVLDSTRGPLP